MVVLYNYVFENLVCETLIWYIPPAPIGLPFEVLHQIKSLINNHNYARNLKLGLIVNYRWMDSFLIREVLENEKLNVMMLKE